MTIKTPSWFRKGFYKKTSLIGEVCLKCLAQPGKFFFHLVHADQSAGHAGRIFVKHEGKKFSFIFYSS